VQIKDGPYCLNLPCPTAFTSFYFPCYTISCSELFCRQNIQENAHYLFMMARVFQMHFAECNEILLLLENTWLNVVELKQ
jgi:hypothetical protein